MTLRSVPGLLSAWERWQTAPHALDLDELQPGQCRQPQPVGWLVADMADLAAQHRVLLPDHQEFGILGRLTAGQHSARPPVRTGVLSAATASRAGSMSRGGSCRAPAAC